MVRFVTDTEGSGKVVVGIGLSRENFRRLKQGQPIVFDLNDLLPFLERDVNVMVLGAENEDDFIPMLAGSITGKTEIEFE